MTRSSALASACRASRKRSGATQSSCTSPTARPRNFPDREEYASARRAEREAALAMAGVSPLQLRDFGYVDQEAYLHLPELTKRIAEVLDELRPDIVLTHPYEGGHPDHDSCAFACRMALDARSAARPYLEEFACYHGGPQGFTPQQFLPGDGAPVRTLILGRAERERKQGMYDCHRTQQHVLQLFGTVEEKFRRAPDYDFLKPASRRSASLRNAGVGDHRRYVARAGGSGNRIARQETYMGLTVLSVAFPLTPVGADAVWRL